VIKERNSKRNVNDFGMVVLEIMGKKIEEYGN
jgi:hypothetical protein